MKDLISVFVCLLLPVKFFYWLLNIIGHNVHPNAVIGFSLVWKTKLIMSENSKIGHFNFISLKKINLDNGAIIRNRNFIVGLFEMKLGLNARVGKNNNISRSRMSNITPGIAKLELGELTCITKNAILDLTSDIIIGDFSQIAGVGCQLWTHGYFHASEGPDRIRIDGKIEIGDNVYIGSGALITPSVKICSGVNVGANSTVSKSLNEPGMYVSQPLRFINKDFESIKKSLTKLETDTIEEIYYKN